MTERNKTARLAGLVYLVLVISGIFTLMYLPSKFIVWDDAAQTLENIVNSELLFRFGIVSSIISFLAFTILPLVLYKLLKDVSKLHAQLMVILVLISVPISFTTILHHFSVLTLIGKAEYFQDIAPAELQTQVMLQLDYYYNGIDTSQIFWGLWLFPFGYLVFKSGFLPRILGIFLMAGCFGYVITFLGGFLYPKFHETLFSTLIGIPDSIGEIGIYL